jgi:hypothetical protein
VHAQGSCFEGDEVSVAVCPTITVQYHHSGTFLAAHRNSSRKYSEQPYLIVAKHWQDVSNCSTQISFLKHCRYSDFVLWRIRAFSLVDIYSYNSMV